MMPLIQIFEQISKHDAATAGGKGASLGEMTQAGIPVPPGYVVLASTFDRFIEETKLKAEIDSILHRVKKEEMESVERASEEIQALILSAKMPKDIEKEIKKYFKELNVEFVAVRSSATAEDSSAAAWAGQLDSFLNTNEKTLLQHVQKCWASLFTPRAIFYRFEKGLHKTHISVAVVVQKMVQSEISGIAFSVHPVTQDYNQMIIEGGFGLGEAIVSGQITPDSYVLEKKPLAIIEKNVSTQSKGIFRQKGGGNEWKDIPASEGTKQKLSEKQIMELGKLILRIEAHYGFPVDVEWAFEKGKFYITQSRPITTLKDNKNTEKIIPVKPAANENPVINGREWRLTVTRNMSFWHQWNSNIAHYHHSSDYGVEGRFNILTLTMNGTQTSCFADPIRYPAYSNAVMRAVSTPAKVDALHAKYVLFAGKLEKALAVCLAKPSLKNWQQFGQEYIRNTAGLMITAQVGREGVARLEKRFKELGYPAEKIPETIGVITYPSHHTPLFQSQHDLLEIGKKIQSKKIKGNEIQKELETWLEQHGYIPVNFCEDPWTLENANEQLAQLMKKDCAKEMEAYSNGHQRRVQHARKLLKEINDNEVNHLAYALQVSTYLNEFRKNLFCRVSLRVRPLFALIAKKAKLSGWRDCYYFTNEELGQMLEGKLSNPQKFIQQRQTVAYEVDDHGKAIILSPSDAEKLHVYVKSHYGQTPQSASGVDTITGFSANKGKVTGIAKIILSSKDFHKLNPKEILVTTMTSVDFVPLMEKAAAFVTNEGGITSHAAIVSREMNKSCIIGTKNATQIIKDGDLIEVDADKGIVKILKRELSVPSFFQNVVKWGTRPMTLQRDEVGRLIWSYYHGKFSSVPLDSASRTCYVNKEDMERVYRQIAEEIMTEKGWERHLKLYDKLKKDMSYLADLTCNSKDNNLAASMDLLNKWYKLIDGFAPYAIGPYAIEHIIDPKLRELLKKEFNEETDGIMAIISSPSELNDYQKMRIDIASIVISGKYDSHTLKELVGNYAWYNEYSFVEPLLDEDYFRTEIEKLNKGEAKREKEKLIRDIKNNARSFGRLQKKLRNPFINLLARVVHTYTFLRTERVDCFKKSQVAMRVIFERVASALKKKTGKKWTKELVAYLLAEEIADFGYNAITPDFDKINERAKNKYVYYYDGEVKILEGNVVEKIKEAVGGMSSEEVKGLTAFGGKARGKVVLVLHKEDLKKVKEGDIFVSKITMPDYTPFMKKASAFVTEEGGITSHAAIISRELKKPCIVATGNCTNVLKDGMEVEVDAEKGVVKILSRSTNATSAEWVMVRARYVPAVLPILYMWAWPVETALGASPETLVCIWDKGHFTVAWKKEVLRTLGENAIAKLHATKNWNALRKAGIAAGEKAVRFCQKFAAHIKTATPEQISHFLDELKLYYQEIMRTNMIFWVFSGTEIEKQLKHALSTFSQEDQTHILHTMSKSEIASYSQHEEETFEALVGLARKKGIADSEVKKGIESFSGKYFWFPFEYVGPVIWTPAIIAERVKEEMKKSPKKKRKENMKKEQSECISKYRLSKEIQHLFKTLQFITLLQDDRKMIHSQVCYYLNGVVLAEVGRRMGMKHGEAYFAENTLIERWAKGEDTSRELRERSRFFVAPQTTENYTCLTGKKARDYLAAQKIQLQADFKEVNELIGQSATKGIVKGRVRVVLIASTAKDFKKGDILLAGMTTPDYIPLMKKAGAIVTDEGGITCHAAIVARELGKPCIIGTKRATKVFKDGDLVEVNATKGIIRKLKP